MVVRIRLPDRVQFARKAAKYPPFVSGLGGLIALVAVSCLMLALWRLTSDLGWTDTFIIADGFLSHWQVWMAMTIASAILAVRLVRYGRAIEGPATDPDGEPAAPDVRSKLF